MHLTRQKDKIQRKANSFLKAYLNLPRRFHEFFYNLDPCYYIDKKSKNVVNIKLKGCKISDAFPQNVGLILKYRKSTYLVQWNNRVVAFLVAEWHS